MMKRIPMEVSGLSLTLAILAQAAEEISRPAYLTTMILSAVFMAMFLVAAFGNLSQTAVAFSRPVETGVSACVPLTWMLYAADLKPLFGTAAEIIWFLAIADLMVLIGYFTIRFVIRGSWNQVRPTHFLVYSGVGMIGVTSDVFGLNTFGSVAFWAGLVLTLIWLTVMIYRYYRYPPTDPAYEPLINLFAMPLSICLTAYMKTSGFPRLNLIYMLYLGSQFLCILMLLNLHTVLRKRFSPSIWALSTPFAMSAWSLYEYGGKSCVNGGCIIMQTIIRVEYAVTIALTLYVILRYLQVILRPVPKSDRSE